MSRTKGTFNFAANFEVNMKGFLDAKQKVGTYADLTSPAIWQDAGGNVWLDDGFPVSVAYDPDPTKNGIYVINPASGYQTASNWVKVATVPDLAGKATLVGGKVTQAQTQESNLSYNSTTGVVTLTDGAGVTHSIDLPIENLFQNASYSSATQTLTLTTNGGGTIDVPLTDLVALPEIQVSASSNPTTTPSSNQKLYFRSDTGSYWISSGSAWVGEFLSVSSAEKATWNNKQNALVAGTDYVVPVSGKQLSQENYTTTEKTKLGNVDQNVSTAEKATWNGKQAALGFTPEDSVNRTATISSSESSTTKYGTIKGWLDYLKQGFVGLLPAKSTALVDGDFIVIGDSEDSNKTKTRTFAQLKATLKTYLDGFYALIGINSNIQTGTTYTLVSGDNGKQVVMTNSAAITVTIPTGFSAGFNCEVLQRGLGQITFVASGTTLRYSSFEYPTTYERYSSVNIDSIAGLTEEYKISGQLTSI